ncbi:MAG: hypothetical protein ACLQBJ_17065 [Bryobacteraceae bacterium]
MRLRLLAFVLLFQAGQLFAQQAAVSPSARKMDRPAASSLPHRFSLVPGLIPQAVEKPTAPARQGAGWFFRNWKQLLPPEPVMIAGHQMQLEPGRCVIPLLRVPLPAHYDDGMIRRLNHASSDQPMVWTPPPDCELSGK